MGYLLRSARGRKQGLAIPIRARVFLIGSSSKSQIRSRKPGVGKRHCAFVSRKKQLYLHDLESGHPTRVNGLIVTPGARLRLKTGDRVALGPMEFVIEERKKKPPVPVATPYSAPPVPMGRPAKSTTPEAAPVPVTAALASPVVPGAPSIDPGANRPLSGVWSIVLLSALAIVGLGAGVGLSRAFLGRGNDDTRKPAERREENEIDDTMKVAHREPIKQDNGDVNRRESRVEIPQEKPPEVKKPVEEKKQPVEEPKKPEPRKEEVKKPDPPMDPTKTPMEQPMNRIAYATQVLPVLKERCVDCHGGNKKKGGLDVSTIEAMLKGGDSGPAIIAGDAEKSPLFLRVDDGSMPPAGKPITPEQKKLLQDWIQGAKSGGFTK